MSIRDDRSHGRLCLLFSTVAALAACGGGGGGDAPTPPPPANNNPPVASLTLTECEAKPVGHVTTFVNTSLPRREWTQGSFEGEAVIVRTDANANGQTVRKIYYKDDAAARTSTTVGFEIFDTAGNVVQRAKYSGRTLSTALTPGQSQTITYSWQDLLPVGGPGGTQTMTYRYDGNEVISLPQGRLEACKATLTISEAGAPLSVSTQYSAKGVSTVKSYSRNTKTGDALYNQVALLELDSTTAALSFAAPTAQTQPSLASCSALQPGMNFEMSASSANEAASARRVSSAATVLGTTTLAMERRHATTDALQSISHFDPVVGFVKILGTENADRATGLIRSETANLVDTAVGASVDYAVTSTPYPSGAATTSNDRFTHLGHERVTTPAGTYDACKVRFNFGSGLVETYWLVPNRFYARLESVSATGVRSTRERLTP